MYAIANAKYRIGQVIHHKRFDYRGVIIDVDPVFDGSETWYRSMTVSQPPKDQPWYKVLVDGAEQVTYVAEYNLEPDASPVPVENPVVDALFDVDEAGDYILRLPLH